MTSSVCPACHAPLALDAHACWRCGLAVRPTCSNCGEALEVGRHACPRCWELIAEPQIVSEGAMVGGGGHIGHEQTMTVTAPVATETGVLAPLPPDMTALTSAWDEDPRQRVRIGRIIGIGVVAGLLVAVGLVGLEIAAPPTENLTNTIHLLERSFPSLGFTIDAPPDWEITRVPTGGRRAVAFNALTRGAANHGFQVVLHDWSFDRAREQAKQTVPDNADTAYHEIDIVDGLRVDDRRTFRHLFTTQDEYREDWWIETGTETFKIEFWAPIAERETTAPLNARIARTLHVL